MCAEMTPVWGCVLLLFSLNIIPFLLTPLSSVPYPASLLPYFPIVLVIRNVLRHLCLGFLDHHFSPKQTRSARKAGSFICFLPRDNFWVWNRPFRAWFTLKYGKWLQTTYPQLSAQNVYQAPALGSHQIFRYEEGAQSFLVQHLINQDWVSFIKSLKWLWKFLSPEVLLLNPSWFIKLSGKKKVLLIIYGSSCLQDSL